MSYTRGDVLWVEVESQPGWWPARVKKVPPRVPEGHLAIRFFGSREIKEVEVDSECMAFDEPVVGENLQNMQPSEFEADDAAQHAKFKAAVAEAQACLAGSGPAPSEDEEAPAIRPRAATCRGRAGCPRTLGNVRGAVL